nr:hypothetical protein [Tanacetum cinerariifolium]
MGDDVDINTLTMEQYMALIQDNIRPGIVKLEIDGDVKFKINGNFMRELRRKRFKGTDDEDAHEHVQRVLEIVDLFHFPGVTHDAFMLRVFPITLSGPALRWKNRLSAGLITTWDLLEKVFIRQCCPSFKTTIKLEKIRNFKKEMDETFDYAWERENQMDNGCDITVKDVERLRKMLTPTRHTLPNLEPVVQPYTPLRLVHDETVRITPPDDDFVALATGPILDKHLNEFGEEYSDITRVSKKADGS